ncbi:ADP-ribosyltransferase [Nocardia sp. GAS34]|uniref:ADP-ribosyltransferase n=1 Tax=unclassified Nocardia TaxID=2637762 RepID=UPI003D1B1803
MWHYTEQSFPNGFLRGHDPRGNVAKHFQRLQNESHGARALSWLNGGPMPKTGEELERLAYSPHATDLHRAWIDHVLTSASPKERLLEMARHHAENDFLHKYFGGTPTPEAFDRRIRELDAALNHPLPEPVRAMRGLHDISFLTAADGHPLGIRDPRALIGTTQMERGYMSTSLGENPAVVDNNPFEYKMKLDLPPGTHGVWMGRKSAYEDQRELLLPRDTQYRITGVTHTGWTQVVHRDGRIENRPVYEIHAKVVPHSAPSPGASPHHDTPASHASARPSTPAGSGRGYASPRPDTPAVRTTAPSAGARPAGHEIPMSGTHSGSPRPHMSRPDRSEAVSSARPDAPPVERTSGVPRSDTTPPGRPDGARPEPAEPRPPAPPMNHDAPQPMSRESNPPEAHPEEGARPNERRPEAEPPPSWLREDPKSDNPRTEGNPRSEETQRSGDETRAEDNPPPTDESRPESTPQDDGSGPGKGKRSEEGSLPAEGKRSEKGTGPEEDNRPEEGAHPNERRPEADQPSRLKEDPKSESPVDDASYRGSSKPDDKQPPRDGEPETAAPERPVDSDRRRSSGSLDLPDLPDPKWGTAERARGLDRLAELRKHDTAAPSELHRGPETSGPHAPLGGRPDGEPRDHPAREPAEPEPAESPTPDRDVSSSAPAEPKPNLRNLFPPHGLPVDEAKLLPQFRRVIDGEYGGLRISVDNITGNSERMMVRSKIYADGIEVGKVRREFLQDAEGRLTVFHDVFSLEKHVQGQGCASAFNEAMIEWYKNSGVKDVTLVANKDVGSYAWARQNFNFTIQHEAVNKFGGRIDRELDNEKAKLRELWLEHDSLPEGPEKMKRKQSIKEQIQYTDKIAELRERFQVGSQNFPTAKEIADLGRPEDMLPGQSRMLSWLGKRVFLEPDALDWRGVMSLEEVATR